MTHVYNHPNIDVFSIHQLYFQPANESWYSLASNSAENWRILQKSIIAVQAKSLPLMLADMSLLFTGQFKILTAKTRIFSRILSNYRLRSLGHIYYRKIGALLKLWLGLKQFWSSNNVRFTRKV